MRKAILFLAMFALAGLVWGADPFVGTWKINVAKSKSVPSQLKRIVITKVEAQGNGYKWTYDIVEANGRIIHSEWSGKLDGKDYPVTGNPAEDTIARKRTGKNSYVYVSKKGGKIVSSGQVVVSKDGKTAINTNKQKNTKGQEWTSVGVLEKQ